ncbi:MAG: glycosyltransferase family A protein [Planctomycetota bacterium]
MLATHDRAELLQHTLRALLQAYERIDGGRIVLVENGGEFGARAIAERVDGGAGRIVYVTCERANKSAALNVGLESCADGLIFMTDDDVAIDAGLLESYAKVAARYGPGHFFGGPTVPEFEQPVPSWRRAYLPGSAKGQRFDASAEFLPEHLTFMGFNWAAYRGDMLAAGGFDPRFGPGSSSGATGQESSMQRRLIKNGCQGVVVHDAEVSHYVPAERSSESWTLARAKRAGTEVGLRVGLTDAAEARRLLRRRQRQLIVRRLRWYVTRKPAHRVDYHYWVNWLQGFTKGLSRAESDQPPD